MICNKILWKRWEIASNEQFLLVLLGAISPRFRTISNVSLTSGIKLHIHLWNMVVRFIFLQFWKADMSRYGSLEAFQRVPWSSRQRSILCKSVVGRSRPVSYPDGPTMARYRFTNVCRMLTRISVFLGAHVRSFRTFRLISCCNKI